MKKILLYNIRSHYNVGAIFRTADGAGVASVALYGVTPAPVDRFGRPVMEIHKTALGAELQIPWETISDPLSYLAEERKKGLTIVAVEQANNSTMLTDFRPPQDSLYIFGSETEGLPEDIIKACDLVLELPMAGSKESLNVSVTAGIVLYHT